MALTTVKTGGVILANVSIVASTSNTVMFNACSALATTITTQVYTAGTFTVACYTNIFVSPDTTLANGISVSNSASSLTGTTTAQYAFDASTMYIFLVNGYQTGATANVFVTYQTLQTP